MDRSDIESLFHKTDLIERKIQKLRLLDLAEISFEELSEKLLDIFPSALTFSSRINNSATFFRVRINETDQEFNSITDLYPPPSSLIKSYGRANRPNQRVFYCSENPLISISEVLNHTNFFSTNSESENFITISEWGIKDNKDLDLALLIYSSFHWNNEIYKKGASKDFKLFFEGDHNGNKPSEQMSESILSQMVFWSDHFANPNIKSDIDYMISAYYFSRLNNDGLLYPTVANYFSGNNYAININSFINKMFPISFRFARCYNSKSDRKNFEVRILKEGLANENGTIDWINNYSEPILIKKLPKTLYKK
jgi:hypothetical protein